MHTHKTNKPHTHKPFLKQFCHVTLIMTENSETKKPLALSKAICACWHAFLACVRARSSRPPAIETWERYLFTYIWLQIRQVSTAGVQARGNRSSYKGMRNMF